MSAKDATEQAKAATTNSSDANVALEALKSELDRFYNIVFYTVCGMTGAAV